MILWFGDKKKKQKMQEDGAKMPAPDLSADEIAAKQAENIAQPTAPVERATEPTPPVAEPMTVPAPKPLAEPVPPTAPEPVETVAPTAPAAETSAPIASPEPAPEPASAPASAPTPEKEPGFFGKLSSGLSKSSSKLGGSLTGLFTKRKLDDDALEDLEDLLLTADLGAKVAAKVTENLANSRYEKDISDSEIRESLASEIETIMTPREEIVDFSDGPSPRLVLFVGVNGSGKTTTIGKIASKLKAQGAKALLVAGDTFRAAAIEQLSVWGDRAGIDVISKPTGSDAAALVYEAFEKAKEDNLDLVLVDTAGRLQNKSELMSELAKIIRVVRKLDPDAPHDVILVLDATVGQNALSQVDAFRHTADITGLVMTKLDGTAKGGVLVAIAEAHALPIHFVGVGESADDLQPFSARAYARALVGLSDITETN